MTDLAQPPRHIAGSVLAVVSLALISAPPLVVLAINASVREMGLVLIIGIVPVIWINHLIVIAFTMAVADRGWQRVVGIVSLVIVLAQPVAILIFFLTAQPASISLS